jgi:hypothetical protein
MASNAADSFGQFDELLKVADASMSPWVASEYVPDLDLFRRLLSLPISQGDRQETGRPAKALDAWIAHELRRSGFSADAVWPRMRRPRVLGEDLAGLELKIENLAGQLASAEAAEGGKRLRPAELRKAIRDVTAAVPGTHAAGEGT